MVDFRQIREKIWPITQEELPKVLLLIAMKFCVTFVYSILFVCKDTIIITSPGLGTELIPILKGTVMIVAAVAVSALYTRLTSRFSFEKVFYFFLLFFVSFFVLYSFYLYPNRENLALGESKLSFIRSIIGEHRVHWLAVFKYWFHTVFFIIAELWGALVIVTLFWGTANTINNVEEASRFYNLFSAGGHVATLISGLSIGFITTASSDYEHSVKYLMLLVVGLCAFILVAIWNINKRYDLSQYKPNTKVKISFSASIKKIVTSQYLLAICLIVVGYGFTMNMVEVFWKDTARNLFHSSSEFQSLMGTIISLIGFFSLIMCVFFSGNIIRAWGWTKSALISPLCISLFGLLFFVFYFAGRYMTQGPESSINFVWIAVMLGAGHNIIAKILKYSMFDLTKEMAYIPLSYEEKINGKAAIDVISSRLGKSGSSWLQLMTMELIGSSLLASTSGYLFPVIALGFATWIWAIFFIGKVIK
ncbi:MAG: translocase [Oligoflexales bacterium]|nr:translocase [Oligoflexales bacterium]